jgi:hypothetical protein
MRYPRKYLGHHLGIEINAMTCKEAGKYQPWSETLIVTSFTPSAMVMRMGGIFPPVFECLSFVACTD